MMLSQSINNDEQVAANLLWQLKAIATIEVEKVNIPYSCIDTFYGDPMTSVEGRMRTISVESLDNLIGDSVSESSPAPNVESMSVENLGRDDRNSSSSKNCSHPLLIRTDKAPRQSKRKRENHVGLTTKLGTVRCTLRKKFSWKQHPELESYLLRNQEEYFEFSSRNYTPEQRQYNNSLTQGLLDLASEEGYVFEEFTFSMVRDRIRCYYKSHSQAAKKKRKKRY